MAIEHSGKEQISTRDALPWIAAAMLIGFGVTLLLISSAYMSDLETLRRVPQVVWQFICGVPSSDPSKLPLLLSVSAVSLLLGLLVALAAWWQRSRRRRS